MTWDRQELKARGKAAMKNNRLACIAVAFIMGIFGVASGGGASFNFNVSEEVPVETLSGEIDPEMMAFFIGLVAVILIAAIVVAIIKMFLGNILAVGGYGFFIKNQAGMVPGIDAVLDGFRSGNYKNLMITMFLRDVYVFLWTMLFIIPGIIKSYEYMMVPYILAENPGMDRKMAFKISKRMMNGQKMDTFVLDLSFFGWALLGSLTLGILNIVYVTPYMEATKAELYAFNKMKGFEEGYLR